MRNHVTLLGPNAPVDQISAALPPDFLKEVRGRVRVLALLFLIAFAFDPIALIAAWVVTTLAGTPLPPDVSATAAFQLETLVTVAASAGLWWAARSDRMSSSRLHTVGLAYQVLICFDIALKGSWQQYIEHGTLPHMTWVPAVVILFPLILPGPPRRMLGAAILSASMSPFAVVVLDVFGKAVTTPDDYVTATLNPAFAVLFAYMGSRVVYGLGREVTAARELGSYRLEERLGQGGMGEVWRASHRMLARPAAIKIIRRFVNNGVPSDVSNIVFQRFEREAQATASLRSPHTVDLFDFGMSEDGVFYYAMELLDGLDTDVLVRRYGPMPCARVAHVIHQMCHSLSEAHASGLVHRDVKPANVFLCRYGEDFDFVKVLDFGLVKALDSSEDSDPALTTANAVHGTPSFIAPEQALGKSDLDGRVDIYATGCVAYWLLTGHFVFTADTPMGLVMHHARTMPTAPSTRTDHPIPQAMDQLILSCLAKDPDERPQSAKELSERLASAADSASWTQEMAREWWARHPEA